MPLKRGLATILAAGGLVAPAHATGGLTCVAEGVELNLTLGHTVTASVVGATLAIGNRQFSTMPDVNEATPIAVGQAFGDESRLLIDFTDDIVNEIVARLRLFEASDGERPVIGGTLDVPGEGAWVVSCQES